MLPDFFEQAYPVIPTLLDTYLLRYYRLYSPNQRSWYYEPGFVKEKLPGNVKNLLMMDFLNKGVLPPIVLPKKEEKPKEGPAPFTPHKSEWGSIEGFLFAAPVVIEPAIDLSFRVGDHSEIIFEEVRPDLLFYRVQLSVTSTRANAAAFKGISPVFETKMPTGKYLYAAGQFYSYADASKALQQIQRLGFKSAITIAYYRTKSVTLLEARKIEVTAPPVTYRVTLGNHIQGLPESLMRAVKALSNKDLIRISGERGAKYVIGPFSSIKEAQELQSALTDRGFEGIIIETIQP